MQLKFESLLTLLIITMIPFPAAMAAGRCGDAPTLPMKAEEAESFKGDAKGRAQALSKYVGSADLAGKVELERKTIYQSSDKIAASQKEAYLAYMFCIFVDEDRSLSALDKVKALQEFRKPISSKARKRAFLFVDAIDIPISRSDLSSFYSNGSWSVDGENALFLVIIGEPSHPYEISYYFEGQTAKLIKASLKYKYYSYTKSLGGEIVSNSSSSMINNLNINSSKEILSFDCNFSDIINQYKALQGLTGDRKPEERKGSLEWDAKLGTPAPWGCEIFRACQQSWNTFSKGYIFTDENDISTGILVSSNTKHYRYFGSAFKNTDFVGNSHSSECQILLQKQI